VVVVVVVSAAVLNLIFGLGSHSISENFRFQFWCWFSEGFGSFFSFRLEVTPNWFRFRFGFVFFSSSSSSSSSSLSLSDVCYLSWKTIKATICFSAGVLCVSADSEKFHKVDNVRADGLQRWNGALERPVTGNIPIVISLCVPVPEPRLFLLISLLKSLLLLTSAKKEEDFCLCVVQHANNNVTFSAHCHLCHSHLCTIFRVFWSQGFCKNYFLALELKFR
jgi:hypothetical protein